MVTKHNQRGFSLFMVMIMMIVIAFLVVITSQSTSTESRLSANEADRKYALSQAEIGLRSGETFLNEIYTSTKPDSAGVSKKAGLNFTKECLNGLCAPVESVDLIEPSDAEHFKIEAAHNGKASVPAWERAGVFDSDKTSRASSNGKSRYIIEYMGQRFDGGSAINDYFRVTSRAHGENQNTVVTLQSYVEMTRTK